MFVLRVFSVVSQHFLISSEQEATPVNVADQWRVIGNHFASKFL
jgi:hypothetical protein